MAIVFITCILAGLFNASSSIFEREAAETPSAHELFSRKLARTVMGSKKFIFGVFLQVLATVMEIIALSKGSLVIVGPLLTLDLVFLWALISLRYKIRISTRSWTAVLATFVGLGLLYICTKPVSGNGGPSGEWIGAIALTVCVMGFSILSTRRISSPGRRAAVMAVGTSFNYSLDAALVKLLLVKLHEGGMHAVLLSWAFYLVIIFAVISIFMMQNTFSSGPLTASQPVIAIVQSLVNVLFGIFIFNDTLRHTWLSITGDVFCSLLLIYGLLALASDKDLFLTHAPKRTVR